MTKEMTVVASRRYGTLSPLRYPGGRPRWLGSSPTSSGIGIRGARVEPYAGGAGAGIALLRQGLVDHLVINDIDPAVCAFWTSAVHDNRRFIRLVDKTPLTIEEWRRQRAIYQAGDTSDLLRLGLAFFYLEPDQPIRHPERRGHRRPGAEEPYLIDARSIGRRSPNA